jgi:hypothetical protein
MGSMKRAFARGKFFKFVVLKLCAYSSLGIRFCRIDSLTASTRSFLRAASTKEVQGNGEEKCMVLVNGQPCGLPVTPIDKALGKESARLECGVSRNAARNPA